MSAGARIPSAEVVPVVKRFVALVQPYTERLVVAGSLRRRLPTCGDVEIVCVPRVMTVERITADLFGDRSETSDEDRLRDFLDAALEDGVVSKRGLGADGTTTRWGPRGKALTFEGVPFDVYATDAEIFGWTQVLRTGPQEFSRQLVVRRGEKTKDRRSGLLPEGLYIEGGLRSRLSGLLIPTPEETDVFAALGIEYREPWQRY